MIFNAAAHPFQSLAAFKCDALVLILSGKSAVSSLDPALRKMVSNAVRLGDFDFKRGRAMLALHPQGVAAPRLVISACGETTVKEARAALQAAMEVIKAGGTVTAGLAFVGFDAAVAESLAEQAATVALTATYLYRATKPSAPSASKLKRLTVIADTEIKSAVASIRIGMARGQAVGQGIRWARELADLPPNVATPSYLAEQALALRNSHGVQVKVLDEKAIAKLGMGAFLAVARGSEEPPRFIVIKYDGASKTQAPMVLIGKGITFDSGGISLKLGAGMEEMKFDMGGAAAVLGTMRAVAELRPKINVVALITACENMPSGKATKPGDVVTSMSGQTIEVLNTDAEGRLILCDALTYAERFNPVAVVDVATLTGACVVALGGVRSGMYANDDDLAQGLYTAGESALDPCWRMPLDEEYEADLKSPYADLPNIGGKAGSVVAAKFLQRFAGNFKWGHLDIAGTAWHWGGAKGSTGRPVALLTHFVLAQAECVEGQL